MPNKQNVQEAAATATATEQLFMEAAEIEDVVRHEADRLTPDVAADIMLAILQNADTGENKDCSRLDKMLWTVRGSYLIGFQKALEAYSDCVKATLQEA